MTAPQSSTIASGGPGPIASLPEPRSGAGWRAALRTWWAGLVGLFLVLGCLGAWAGARALAHSDAAHARLAFHASTGQIAASLHTAIEHEEDLVISASAYIAEHPHVTPAEFNRWAHQVRSFERYPELENLGLVKLVPAKDLSAFEVALARNPVLALEGEAPTAAGGGALEILPPGKRPYYCFAVAGLSRSRATYIPAGVDYCALAPGLITSLSSGQASYAPFSLAGGDGTALGVETPVYAGGLVPASVTERHSTFIGWLGELLTPTVVIRRALDGYAGFAITLRYHRGSEDDSFTSGTHEHGGQHAIVDLHNGWSVYSQGPAASAATLGNLNSTLVLIGGVIVCLLLGILMIVLGTGRTRALLLVEEKTRELSHQALHDSLTGLPNRALVLDRARGMLARSRRANTIQAGVLFIDIDGFKQVNDQHGHEAGDRLLQAVAHRLAAVVRAQDTVGRLGGDEFVVLAESNGDPNALTAIAHRIIEALHEPIELEDGTVLPLTASIGITAGRYSTAEELLRDADQALYQAKADGKDRFAIHAENAPAGI